ncbi:MAG: hypothetical protein V3S50_10610 [Acidobacteriota bacterium]
MRLDGFRPEYLDFQRGIRVGHLEPHQRITQILKHTLQDRYQEDFVIDRWGRGVYWQWICFLPKANRIAKPLSGSHNFSCSKFFIKVDRNDSIFKSGLHVERGLGNSSKDRPAFQLQEDWDWHRLIKGLRGNRSRLYRALRRLVLEDRFHIHAGTREKYTRYSHLNFPSAAELRRTLTEYTDQEWVVFQLYYPMAPDEVKGSTGSDLIEAILAVLQEVVPVMNLCMQVPLPEP